MKTVKLIAVLLITVMLTAGLFASGSGDTRSSPVQGNPKLDIDLMTIAFVGGGWPDDFIIIKKLDDKLNINLTIQWVPTENFSEKISVLAASNSFSDSYLLQEAQFMRWVNSGIFLDIKPMLDNYKNLSTYLDKSVYEVMCPPGKYYGIPYYAIESRDSMYIRKDWLDKLGLKMPDTLEDFLNVAKAFAQNDPDGNGKADTIGFTTSLASANDITGTLFYLAGAFGVPNGWKLDSGGNLVPWQVCTNEMKGFLGFMKRMYDEGALDKDFVFYKSNQDPINKFISGKAGISDNNPMNLQTGIQPPLEQNVPGAVIVPLTPPQGPTGIRATKTFATNQKIVINSKISADKQKRVLELYDYMLSDEGYDMIKNGIEGIHYISNADGTFTKLPAFDDDRPYLLSTWLIRRADPLIQIRKWDSKDLASEILSTIQNASQYVVRNSAQGLASDTNNKVGANIDDKLKETIARVIVGELDVSAYDKAVDDWRKGGGDAIIKEINDAYSNMK